MGFRLIGCSLLIYVAGYFFFSFSTVTAQTLVPGIHGISIVQGVKFTWVIISSDREISANLRYVGNGSAPPILVTATALINLNQSNKGPVTIGGSQVLGASWTTPNSLSIRIEGSESLFDSDLITVVASPYTGPPCDSSYPDFCIAPPPPYLNCLDIPQKNFKVLKPDPHRFDDDNDGIGCESP